MGNNGMFWIIGIVLLAFFVVPNIHQPSEKDVTLNAVYVSPGGVELPFVSPQERQKTLTNPFSNIFGGFNSSGSIDTPEKTYSIIPLKEINTEPVEFRLNKGFLSFFSSLFSVISQSNPTRIDSCTPDSGYKWCAYDNGINDPIILDVTSKVQVSNFLSNLKGPSTDFSTKTGYSYYFVGPVKATVKKQGDVVVFYKGISTSNFQSIMDDCFDDLFCNSAPQIQSDLTADITTYNLASVGSLFNYNPGWVVTKKGKDQNGFDNIALASLHWSDDTGIDTIPVVNCFEDSDCSSGYVCDTSGSWQTFSCIQDTSDSGGSTSSDVFSGFVETAPSSDPGWATTGIDSQAFITKLNNVKSKNGKVTEVGWYCSQADGTQNYEIGIYADNGGKPGAILYSDALNTVGSCPGWKKVTGLEWFVSANTDYWLGVQVDNVPDPGVIKTQVYTTGEGSRDSISASTLPNPWVTTMNFRSSGSFPFYALWEDSGSFEAPTSSIYFTITANPGQYDATSISITDAQPQEFKDALDFSDIKSLPSTGPSVMWVSDSIPIKEEWYSTPPIFTVWVTGENPTAGLSETKEVSYQLNMIDFTVEIIT